MADCQWMSRTRQHGMLRSNSLTSSVAHAPFVVTTKNWIESQESQVNFLVSNPYLGSIWIKKIVFRWVQQRLCLTSKLRRGCTGGCTGGQAIFEDWLLHHEQSSRDRCHWASLFWWVDWLRMQSEPVSAIFFTGRTSITFLGGDYSPNSLLWGSLLEKKRLAAICSGRVPRACPPRVRLVVRHVASAGKILLHYWATHSVYIARPLVSFCHIFILAHQIRPSLAHPMLEKLFGVYAGIILLSIHLDFTRNFSSLTSPWLSRESNERKPKRPGDLGLAALGTRLKALELRQSLGGAWLLHQIGIAEDDPRIGPLKKFYHVLHIFFWRPFPLKRLIGMRSHQSVLLSDQPFSRFAISIVCTILQSQAAETSITERPQDQIMADETNIFLVCKQEQEKQWPISLEQQHICFDLRTAWHWWGLGCSKQKTQLYCSWIKHWLGHWGQNRQCYFLGVGVNKQIFSLIFCDRRHLPVLQVLHGAMDGIP